MARCAIVKDDIILVGLEMYDAKRGEKVRISSGQAVLPVYKADSNNNGVSYDGTHTVAMDIFISFMRSYIEIGDKKKPSRAEYKSETPPIEFTNGIGTLDASSVSFRKVTYFVTIQSLEGQKEKNMGLGIL